MVSPAVQNVYFVYFNTKAQKSSTPQGGYILSGSAFALPLSAGRNNQLTVTVASALVLVTPVASVITQR